MGDKCVYVKSAFLTNEKQSHGIGKEEIKASEPDDIQNHGEE